ncbi:hypothetical protein [Halosimplex marinum]|uniref:hypothetical protein n=1 Tax=Halosimplex marinum TaxID=3396620 RepID=UPI003F55B73F
MSEQGDEQTGREAAAEALCEQNRKILGVFTIAVVFLLLQLPYLVVTDADSSLFVVAVMNVVGSAAFALLSGWALWFCRQRAI